MKDNYLQKNFKKGATYLSVLALLIFGGLYSYGFIITTNVIFDESQPTTYQAEILNKWIFKGKATRFYFELGGWGPKIEKEDFTVPEEIYYSKEIGDSTGVYFKKGLYNISYYFINQ